MKVTRGPSADGVLIVSEAPKASRLSSFRRPSWAPLLAAGPGGAAAVLHPDTWSPGATASGPRLIPYEGRLSITRHLNQWKQLARGNPVEVHVAGGDALVRHADALAIAAYLRAEKAIFHSRAGERDVSREIKPLTVDFRQKSPIIRRLEHAAAQRIASDMARHYLDLVAANGYRVPERENRQSDVRTHFSGSVGLAQDLMMRSPAISGNAWWTICSTDRDEIVESVDRTLAYARFLEKLPGVRSALEIGCGSGFVTLFLAGGGRFAELVGTDVSPERVAGARILAGLSNVTAEFRVTGAEKIEAPDKSFDVVLSCFVLEQCAEVLDRVIDECLRVARKFVVLFEPSIEAFPTLSGLVHIPMHGFPTDYIERFMRKGLSFSVIRPPLRHIYNPGVIHVLAVDGKTPPHVACPELLSRVMMTDA